MKKITIIFFSCYSISLSQQVYFPLKVGNEWLYDGNGPWGQITSVKDTVMPNGKQYACLQNFYGVKYHRQEGNIVYQYFSGSQKEDTLFVFSVEGDNRAKVFGRELRHWSFIVGPGCIDCKEYYDVVDSIGITSVSAAFYYVTLKSATIDGKTYETTGVPAIQSLSPNIFNVFQNYPNPFNPQTKISFSIPTSGRVNLIIYSVLGEQIKTIELGNLQGGINTITFNGGELSSGVYFYRIDFGLLSMTKKFVLLK